MNNQNLGWNIPRMEENIIDYVIPFAEENYNVSTRISDRAMVGLSGGGNLTINMYYDHPDLFGYFADFSGSPRQRDPNTDAESLEKYKLPTVMAVVGTLDFASNPGAHASVEQFAADCRRTNPDHFVTTDDELYVNGSHDWFTWTQSFYKFLKDVAWINTESTTINATGSQQVYIEAEDWGPVVTKTIIHLDHEITKDSIDNDDFTVIETKQALSPEWTETTATKTRTILAVYPSDELGNEIAENSSYFAIEMYVSPTGNGEGAAFFYSPETWYNQWCELYELDITLNGELVTVDNKVVANVDVEKAIDLSSDEDRICPVLDLFTKGQFEATDGNVLPFTYYQPAQDDKQNALVVWLHGAGEGGTNPEIPVLGNEVTALVSEEFQKEFDGAYVLVPQCPEGYGWPVDANGDYTSGVTPSRWRESLFELIDTYVKANPDIDVNRIIIGGCSNGGNMVYDIVLSHMGYFAAAFPMCHEFDIEVATKEQLAYLKDFPVWSTYTLEDSSSYIGSIPIVEKMQEIDVTNFHYSEFEDASETTGRFFGDPDDLYSLDTTGTSTTPLKYNGHWAWTKFFNNACEEGELNAWHWLGQQMKVAADNTPDVPDTPNDSINTGDHLNVMPLVAVATVALLGASVIAYKKKT